MEVKEIIEKVEKFKKTNNNCFEKIISFLEGALFVVENGEGNEKQNSSK